MIICDCFTPKEYITTVNGWRVYSNDKFWLVSKKWFPNLIHRWVQTTITQNGSTKT